MFYVNVYELDRSFGGDEEGGWWFDSGELELSVKVESEEHAEVIADMLREVFPDNGNRYSVTYWRKARDYSVMVETEEIKRWSDYEPYS